MRPMDIVSDFSDVDTFFLQGQTEVDSKVEEIGQKAVDYAKQNGDYQDRTGTLRNSNDYEVDKEGLLLKNEAQTEKGDGYASYVESKGFDVLSGAALEAERKLKEEFE